MGWRGGTSAQSRSSQNDDPLELTTMELDFAELIAKGLDSVAAARSLGVSHATGAQIFRALTQKLNASDEAHLRHAALGIVRSRPSERFAVLDC
jgi:DNA-binding NarL/FixJ family response regulator